MLNFFSTDQARTAHSVKLCVYAPSGFGKTLLGATLPQPLLIGAEEGDLCLSVANITKVFGAGRNDIAYSIPGIRVTTLPELLEAYNFCATSPHMAQFNSIHIDSISEIAEKVLGNSLKTNKDGRKAYGEMQEIVSGIIRAFRDIPNKHVCFTAKQDREVDGATGLSLWGPMMPGKYLTQNLPHFFDEVFALQVVSNPANNTKFRRLLTAGDLQYSAKDRSGALAEYEEPHLGQVIKKIQSYVTKR